MEQVMMNKISPNPSLPKRGNRDVLPTRLREDLILNIFKFILLVLVFIFIFGLFSGKIWDPDFWWHLKTGEYIYQTHSIPTTDPFAYTSLTKDPINPESKRIPFILGQYWIAQVVFYLIYKYFSFQGIIYMRAVVLTALTLLLYLHMRREGTRLYASLFLLMPAVIVLSSFTGERPQLFSFLFVFLLIYLMEGYRLSIQSTASAVSEAGLNTRRLRHAAALYLIPIPFVIILWANMHGGFILGIIIMLIYMFSETVKYKTKKFGQPLPSGALKAILITGAISIFSSLLNPNTYNVIPILIELEHGRYSTMVLENSSPLKLLASGFYNRELIIYSILLSVCIIMLLIKIRKFDLTDFTIFAAFALLSSSAIRTIPFFAPIAAAVLARYGKATILKIPIRESSALFRRFYDKLRSSFQSPLYHIIVPFILSIIIIYLLSAGNLFQRGFKEERYPVGAVNFLKTNKIYGNMFNPYVWGGYILWALYPEYKVFIDGRGLIEEVFLQAGMIMGASSLTFNGIPQWEAILQAYNVQYIITYSLSETSGRLESFIPALINAPEWHLIYMDNNSLIFLKDSPENSAVMRQFEMPKEWLWNEVITEAALKSPPLRGKPDFYITIGDALSAKRNYPDARTAYLKAKELAPRNIVIQQKLDELNLHNN